MNKIKNVLPWLIAILFGEILIYMSLIGRPSVWWSAYVIAAILIHPIIILLNMTNWFGNFIVRLNKAVRNECNKLKSVKWKKFVIVILIDCVGALAVEAILDYHIGFNWRVYLWLLAIALIISLIVCYRKAIMLRVENIALTIIIVVGSLYAFTMPISCGIAWDDETHFRSAFMMSHMIDGYSSAGDAAILNQFVNTALQHDIYTAEAHAQWINSLDMYNQSKPIQCGRLKPVVQNWCYIPSAIGLTVGRALSFPYHMQFVMGRWFNLLAYALLIFLSIKKIKTGKMLIATVSLLPPCIFMAASYSRDPWMIGFIIYGFSYLFGELQEPQKKIKVKDVIIILGALVIGTMPKAIYAPLILVALFVPKSKFNTEKQHRIYIMCVLGVTLLALATFVLPFIVARGGSQQDNRGGDVNAVGQTAYVLADPIGYIIMLVDFLKGYFSLDHANEFLPYVHYFGTMGHGILIELVLSIVALTDCDNSGRYIGWKIRVSTLVLSLGCIILAATAMYIAFTPYMYETILGCQYRYVLQILFPVLFVLGSVPIKNKINVIWYRGGIFAVMCYILMSGIWNLCISGFRG